MAPSRNRNRLTDRRLWDDIGEVWDLIDSRLARGVFEELLNDSSIRICVHDDFGESLRWIAPEDRARTIKRGLASWFAEDFHRRSRGRYFTTSLWGKGGLRLLLFDAD
ncbi:MAG TPA: hypothetical protein VIO80_14780 [Candidatus Dormibacteraeota bacterium]|jgi:hypothetical protein